MTPMRYGIIGCGMMGQEHIRNIAILDGAEVTALCDPDAGMRGAAQALVPGAVAVADLADLLALPDLDALVIVSPNDCHVGQMEQIAATRPLPLLVEKPLFTDPDDAARLAALHARYPAPIWVAMEYRYMPPIAALIDKVAEVTGGVRMLTIREHRFPFLDKVGGWNRYNARTGGTLVEKCCHFFDLMRLVVGAEPVRIMASGAQDVNHKAEHPPAGPPDIWDNAYVIVDFTNGARGMLELCMFAEGSEFQEEITALGPLGKIEAKVPGPTRFWPADLGPPPVSRVIVSPRRPKRPQMLEIPVDEALLDAGDHNGSTFYQHQKFLQVLRGQGTVEVSFDDGLRAVLMGQAAQRSALEGQAVASGLPTDAPQVQTPMSA